MDRFFEFEKAKLFDTWKRARNNKYSNPDFQEFHDYFKEFYEKIKNEDVSSLSEEKKTYLKYTIDYFQTRVNCLSNNTATNAPYEIIESIKRAAKEWVSDIDKYIILTRYGDYSFSYDCNELPILSYIANDYGLSFDKKTILLSIPHHYYRDYLNNVVLYHEIGHFVDIVNNISAIATQLTLTDIKNDVKISDIYDLFPHLSGISYTSICDESGNPVNDQIFFKLRSHWMEYYADIFAASYIGANIKRYLSYVAYPDCSCKKDAISHPSNEKRFYVIDAYLELRSNYVIDKIQEIMSSKFKKNLRTYCNTVEPDDIYKFLPVELRDDFDIHSIYSTAWDIWYGDRSRFVKDNNLSYELQPTQIYSILNNLVEKSISNYLIKNKWSNVSK